MNRWHRHIVRVTALLAAAAFLVPAAQAGSNPGDVGFARAILMSQYGYSPSQAVDWTTGVCSYADKPSSCYLTAAQARAQSYAQARAMGAPITSSTPSVIATATGAFDWGDAGIGAAATLGIVLVLVGLGAVVVRGRRRQVIHA